MKNFEKIAAEINAAMESPEGIVLLGRKLVAEHREYAAHLSNGISYEEIGESHLEEQIRLYLLFTADRSFWTRLVALSESHSLRDTNAMAPMFSAWAHIHDDLIENIGQGFTWVGFGTGVDLGNTTFAQRVERIVSVYGALKPAQLRQLELGLSLEEGESPAPRQGGCYVATAVYGSYDATEVRVLRNWRDARLKTSAAGRLFIRVYYATSPGLVDLVGERRWFVAPTRVLLNRLVHQLKKSGFGETTTGS